VSSIIHLSFLNNVIVYGIKSAPFATCRDHPLCF
jgi:hypothetical protein